MKGQKTGGRKRGTPNKATVAREKLLNDAMEGGDPLQFFADILSNKDANLQLRFAAARELAPYLHPKLSSTEARVKVSTHEETLDVLDRVLAEKQASNGKAN